MGKIDINTLGLSGKIGPVIAYLTKDGRQVFRQYTKPNDPKTPKQLAYRQKFSLVNSTLSPLCRIIGDGYKNQTNGYNKVKSYAMRHAVEGEYPNFYINYSKIQIAEGKLQLPVSIKAAIDKSSAKVRITWDTQSDDNTKGVYPNDRVNIVCLNAGAKTAMCRHGVARRELGKAEFDFGKMGLTNGDSSDLHFWIYLTSNDYKENSGSWYVKVI